MPVTKLDVALNRVQTIIDDMTLYHDGPSVVLREIGGWGSGVDYPRSNPKPSNYLLCVPWTHNMEDTNHSNGNGYPWRVSGPYTGNTASNTSMQQADIQVWWLLANNTWQLGSYNATPGDNMYPLNWNEGVDISAGSKYRVETNNGGGASVLDIGRDGTTLANHLWHTFSASCEVPAGFLGMAVMYFARKTLFNTSGIDDRSSCKILSAGAADWYRNYNAWSEGLAQDVNVVYAGVPRLKYISNDWQLFGFSSVSAATLRANPPPVRIDNVNYTATSTVVEVLPTIIPQTGITLPTANSGYEFIDNEYKRLYGNPWFIDSLGNTTIKNDATYETAQTISFKNPFAGTIQSIRLYLITSGSGYAGGTAGTADIKILPNRPTAELAPDMTATPYGVATLAMSGVEPYHEIPITSALAIPVNTQIHVLVRNSAASPTTNFFSVNNICQKTESGYPNQFLNSSEFCSIVLFRTIGSTGHYSIVENRSTGSNSGLKYAPIIQVKYTDGTTYWGQGNVQTGNIQSPRVVDQYAVNALVTSTTPIRTVFTPNTVMKVVGMFIDISAAVAGSLHVKLKQNDAVLAEGLITQSTVDLELLDNYGLSQPKSRLKSVIFNQTVTLTAGVSVYLEITPFGSSQWRAAAELYSYLYSYPAAFTQGQAQQYVSGVWVNYNPLDPGTAGNYTNWRTLLVKEADTPVPPTPIGVNVGAWFPILDSPAVYAWNPLSYTAPVVVFGLVASSNLNSHLNPNLNPQVN